MPTDLDMTGDDGLRAQVLADPSAAEPSLVHLSCMIGDIVLEDAQLDRVRACAETSTDIDMEREKVLLQLVAQVYLQVMVEGASVPDAVAHACMLPGGENGDIRPGGLFERVSPLPQHRADDAGAAAEDESGAEDFSGWEATTLLASLGDNSSAMSDSGGAGDAGGAATHPAGHHDAAGDGAAGGAGGGWEEVD